jgi:hypothetical protein
MKGTTYKKASEYSASRTLKRFFAKYPDANSITVEQIFTGVDRDAPEYAAKNEGWLSNKLTALYHHSLVKPVYSFHPWRKLERLELTQKGKTVLNREDAPGVADDKPNRTIPVASYNELTIDDILKALPKINEGLTTHRLKVILEDKEVQPTQQKIV